MNKTDKRNDGVRTEIDLMHYVTVILKRKWIVLAFGLPLFIAVTVWSLIAPATYTATGTILIERELNILSFEQILQIESFNDDYFQTQYKLLQSRNLASRVIDRRRLAGAPIPAPGGPGPGPLKDDLTDPKTKSEMINRFLARLTISPVRQTRLVDVSFSGRDPQVVADTVNTIFDCFIDMNIETKSETTAQATEFLGNQIATLKDEIKRDEIAMQQYGADKNIIALSNSETTIVEKLGELNKALTDAQVDRVNKETYYNAIKDVAPEFIPEALINPLIQRLREDYNKLKREYLKMQERFKEDYPELQRLKTELESARLSLEAEAQNLQKAAYSDWQAALSRERSLTWAFNVQKQEAIQLNSNAISYNQLRIELENKKSLLENLMKRQSETDVSARLKGLRTSNIRVVDRAEAPLFPSAPKKKRNMLLALLVGLAGGVGLAFLFERLDDSVKTFEDIDKTLGLPVLGIVPAFSVEGSAAAREDGGSTWRKRLGFLRIQAKKGSATSNMPTSEVPTVGPPAVPYQEDAAPPSTDEPAAEMENGVSSIDLMAFWSPKSHIADSYRSLRTALLLSSATPRPQCIGISSALPREGKTATLANLGVTLAQAGKKVLVVDADLRKPRLHRVFKVRNQNGLTNYLTGKVGMDKLIKVTEVPNLLLINSGPVPPNPVELLGSEKMTSLIGLLRKAFDYVLFDTPPILAVTEALDLGAKLDGIILVVWGEKTSRDALIRAHEKLEMVKVRTLGVVLNNLAVRKHGYYYRHGYYGDYGEPT